MDGVIVRSTTLHTLAWKQYLSRLGVESNGIMDLMLGKRNDQIVRDILGAQLPPGEVAHHGAAKEYLYRELMGPVLEENLVHGAVDFVRAAAAAGVPCALATNAEPRNVEFILKGAGLEGCFSAIVDGHQVLHAKPDPEVFLTAASRLGVPPGNCVVFEDSPGGLTAARSAGARVVALLTTLASAPLADLQIKDFCEPSLLPWLSTQQPH